MVDTAAPNKDPLLDRTNFCPHMDRLGICLEPEMCFLIHRAEPSQLSTQAQAFNPFMANPLNTQSKEFVPPQTTQEPPTVQSGIISMLNRMGMDA